jgi:peptidoglycan hydrolase CwlO-like protein
MSIIKRLIGRLVGTAARPQSNGRAAALQQQVERSNQDLAKHKANLEKRQAKLDKEVDLYKKAMADAKQAADKAMGLNKKLLVELEAKDQELYTANEIVIPGLVAANSTFKELWSAESARHVYNQIAAEKAPSG